MRKALTVLMVCSFMSVIFLAGCTQKAASSKEAIETSNTMETVEEKANYLMGQANAFYSSEEFQQAVDVAQHVLRTLDNDSQEAKSLIEKAKEALKTKAQEAVDKAVGDVKGKIDAFGK